MGNQVKEVAALKSGKGLLPLHLYFLFYCIWRKIRSKSWVIVIACLSLKSSERDDIILILTPDRKRNDGGRLCLKKDRNIQSWLKKRKTVSVVMKTLSTFDAIQSLSPSASLHTFFVSDVFCLQCVKVSLSGK